MELQSVSEPPSQKESMSDYRTGSDVGSVSDTDNFWNPFESREDYALALWFLESGLSDGDIEKFFRNVHLQ